MRHFSALVLAAVLCWPLVLQAHGNTGPVTFPEEVPPWLWEEGGPFALINHLGRPVRAADFRGRYMLIYFGYSHCNDACPLSLTQMARSLDALGEQGQAIQPLFITTDPKRDRPEVLANYVPRFHPRLIGLTGDKLQVFRATKTYGVRYYSGRIDGKDEVSHTDNLYLMGPDGRLRGYYPTGIDQAALEHALQDALAQPQQ